MSIYLVRNKLLLPARTRKLNTGKLLSYSMIDPVERTSALSLVSENKIARYRWWWRYLRMCLELEQKGVLVSRSKIRVDRAYYKRWDIDDLFSLSFVNWWKAHNDLFIDEPVELLTKVEMDKLAKGYSRGNSNDYHFLKVPKRMAKSMVVEQVKNSLEHRMLRRSKDFEFTGKSVPMIRHHILFNCLVLYFNGASREKIMNWCNYPVSYTHLTLPTKA